MADSKGTSNRLLVLFSFLLTVCCHKHAPCDHIPKQKIDHAFLTVEVSLKENITLQTMTTECHTCHLQPVANLGPDVGNGTILVDTRWPMRWAIVGDDITDTSCSDQTFKFLEGGNYTIFVKSDKKCGAPVLLNSPQDSNIPIYVALGAIVCISLIWYAMKRFYRSQTVMTFMYRFSSSQTSVLDPDSNHGNQDSRELDRPISSSPVRENNLRRRIVNKKCEETDTTPVESAYTAQDLGVPTSSVIEDTTPKPKKERLKSLDTFRGISIVLMIFVNYRGGDYWFFRHSKWNGLTVADLVFPWFVWIMGTSMAFSFQALLKRLNPKKKIFLKIIKRSCILFALGLLINSSDGLNPVRLRKFRIPGVLQRFAGTYLIVATVHLLCIKSNDPNQYTWYSSVRDVADYWKEWIFHLALVLLWLLLTFVLPVPGCPAGYLGPGGLANDSPGHNVSNCTGGAASYIDRTIFGVQRIYQTPTCKEVYVTTIAHDPEGLLGTLTSCFMCFLGLQAGKILLTFPDWIARVRRFLLWGVILGIMTVILCFGRKDGGPIPINKNLWSLSFVICMSSFAFFLFTFCYLTIDVYKVWSGAPFYYPGMNAILLYMGHEMINQPCRRFWGVEPNSHAAYMGVNVADTAVWVLLAYFMFHKNIFISV